MLLGHIHLQLGVSYCKTEQNSEGERNFLKSYEFLVPYRSSSECIIAFVSACNQVLHYCSMKIRELSMHFTLPLYETIDCD